MSSENRDETEKHLEEHHEHHRRHDWRKIWFIPLILIAIAAKGAIVMWLWNCLIPELFHGPELRYLQAIGLTVLAKVLVGHHHGGPFGKFGRGGRCGHHRRGGRWAHLSDKEREELRDHLRKRWGKE